MNATAMVGRLEETSPKTKAGPVGGLLLIKMKWFCRGVTIVRLYEFGGTAERGGIPAAFSSESNSFFTSL